MTPDPRLVASPALSYIKNVKSPYRRHPEVNFNTCNQTNELSASRRYSCLFCTHITSLNHIRNVEIPYGCRPEVAFNTCSEISRQAACRKYSCPHITSFNRIWNIETPCGRRPEAGKNTCSAAKRVNCPRATTIRAYFTRTSPRLALILQSHHLVSSHMSASLAPNRVTETVFDNTSI